MGGPCRHEEALNICLVEGCESTDTARRGMCHTHYDRWRRTGSMAPKGVRNISDEVARFWSKVDRRGAADCWPWLGSRTYNGYGRFTLARRVGTVRASRYAYELVVGQIPDGLTIDHLCHDLTCTAGDACRHRACVNPAHMVPSPGAENTMRGHAVSGNNSRKTHCDYGHAFDETNTFLDSAGARQCRICSRRRASEAADRRRGGPPKWRRTTPEIRAEIAEAEGTYAEVAERFGVSRGTVARAKQEAGTAPGPGTRQGTLDVLARNAGTPGFAGRKHSKEAKEAQAAYWRGRTRGPFTEEHRQALSAARLGRKLGPQSPEHSRKIGDAVRAAADRRRKARTGA